MFEVSPDVLRHHTWRHSLLNFMIADTILKTGYPVCLYEPVTWANAVRDGCTRRPPSADVPRPHPDQLTASVSGRLNHGDHLGLSGQGCSPMQASVSLLLTT